VICGFNEGVRGLLRPLLVPSLVPLLVPFSEGTQNRVPSEKGTNEGTNEGTNKGLSKPRTPSLNPQITNHKNIKNIGGAGFYIFNLVGYDYKEADTGTRNAIDQLITNHGEYKLCYMADDYVNADPGIGLRLLLEKISKNAKSNMMPALKETAEIEY
jgi:hypothetical protein